MSSDGFITFQSTENHDFLRTQHFPALNANPVDVVGAGDSLLTTLAVSVCAGANIMEASVIGAIVTSLAVAKMGNMPVKMSEVKKVLSRLTDKS